MAKGKEKGEPQKGPIPQKPQMYRGQKIIDVTRVARIDGQKRIQREDRITFVGNLSHEHFGDNPKGAHIVYTAFLKTKHQPFEKRREITESPELLLKDCWIPSKDVGYIYIENRTGKGMLVQPGKKEREVMSKKIVFLRCQGASSGNEIGQGEIYFGKIERAEEMILVSALGSIEINITIFPR